MDKELVDRLVEITQDLHEGFIPAERITVDAKFSDIDIDSIDLIEIVYEAEKLFDVAIPDQEIENLTNLQDLIKLIDSILSL